MSELIDQAVAERALARALANGGRFAEVFAERRRGQTLAIDESRIESVQSGAEEGAGVRVVDGNTTYFAHVDGLDPAEVERAADEAAAALRAERSEPQPLQARAATPLPIEQRPEDVPAERKAELLRELDERPAPRAPRSPSSTPPTGRPAARSPSPTPTGSSPATTAPGSGSASRRSPVATARSRPAPRPSAPTAASSCSKTTRARSPSRRRPRR